MKAKRERGSIDCRSILLNVTLFAHASGCFGEQEHGWVGYRPLNEAAANVTMIVDTSMYAGIKTPTLQN